MQELAVFLQFKKVFRSGNFHSHKVPPSLHLSRVTFKKYIQAFLKIGWCEVHGNGFRMKSIRKISLTLPVKFKKVFRLHNGNKAKILTQLRGLVILHKVKHISYVDYCTKHGITYSKLKKHSAKMKAEIINGCEGIVQFGTKGIGKAFGRSKTTGHRVKRTLMLLGQLKRRQSKSKLIMRNADISSLNVLREQFTNLFMIGRNIMQRQADFICYREM